MTLIKQLGGTLGEEVKEPPKQTTQEGNRPLKPRPISRALRGLALRRHVRRFALWRRVAGRPGKEILLRARTNCHKAEEFAAYRHTRQEYQTIVYRMGDRGARATTQELDKVAAYLYRNFPKVEETGKINANKASAKEIETGLGLTAAEGEAVVKYRERHGDFRVRGDLLVIYGVDGRKIEAAQDRMTF